MTLQLRAPLERAVRALCHGPAGCTGLLVDIDRIREDNERRTDVERKAGLIIWSGREWRFANHALTLNKAMALVCTMQSWDDKIKDMTPAGTFFNPVELSNVSANPCRASWHVLACYNKP